MRIRFENIRYILCRYASRCVPLRFVNKRPILIVKTRSEFLLTQFYVFHFKCYWMSAWCWPYMVETCSYNEKCHWFFVSAVQFYLLTNASYRQQYWICYHTSQTAFYLSVLLFCIALLTMQILNTLSWKGNKEVCVYVFVQHWFMANWCHWEQWNVKLGLHKKDLTFLFEK